MTLKEIINVADRVYPDGLVGDCHREPEEDHGDTLAKFIAVELKETYDEKATDIEQLVEALRAMKTAARELQSVVDEFERELYE